MSTFILERTIKFADVDPARIVFYPRYFEMINETVEDWFRLDLDADFRTMATNDRGTPLVRIEAQFKKPGYLYDRLQLRLTPAAIGRSSLALRIEAVRDVTTIFHAELSIVHVDLGSGKPASWPDDLRQRIKTRIRAVSEGDVSPRPGTS